VHDRRLLRFRDAVRRGDYVLTYHGLDEMEQDLLSVLDLESCILTGAIVDRQRDWQTGEWKYVIRGRSMFEAEMAVVVKSVPGGRMAFLTVFRI
jgi:hypothetical protein